MSAQLTDRELLEFAAKAAGMETNHHWNASRMALSPPVVSLVVHRSGELVSTAWNPLINDGDALRLAVKLNFSIEIQPDNRSVVSFSNNNLHIRIANSSKHSAEENLRRAIVRAAAEIGKAMP